MCVLLSSDRSVGTVSGHTCVPRVALSQYKLGQACSEIAWLPNLQQAVAQTRPQASASEVPGFHP